MKGEAVQNKQRAAAGLSPSLFTLRSSRGFTLLEILIVVLLIGIITSFAVLSIGSRALDDRLDTEARRLSELFQLAADEAVLQGVELGFVHTPEGYAFLSLKDGQWLQAEDGVLRPRPLAEPFYLQLRVEGRVVPPAEREEDDEEPLKPQVMLLSSGEATAFSLDLRARSFGPYYQLEGDALGRIKLRRKEPSS